MRIFSLVLAAAVMAVGLAVSNGASADKPTNYKLFTEGEILMKTGDGSGHHFTILWDKSLFGCTAYTRGLGLIWIPCEEKRHHLECAFLSGQEKSYR